MSYPNIIYLINDSKPKHTIQTKAISSWFLFFSLSSRREAVWEFSQSHNYRAGEPRWVHWLQTPPVLQLRARDRRSGGWRGRGRRSKEEKERQLAKPIRTLLHHGCEALRGVTFPQPPHLLRCQYLLFDPLPILLLLNTPKQARLGLQQWISSWAQWRNRRKGAGSHGCLWWHSEITITSPKWEPAKQQWPHSNGVRWESINTR